MKISATKAAKMAGVTTPTVTRAIERNDISADKKPRGGYLIEEDEVLRWMDNRNTKPIVTPEIIQSATPNNNNALQVEVDMLRERLADRDNEVDDLRSRLDKSDEDRRASQARLEDHREKAIEKAENKPVERVGLFKRMFGG